MKEAAYKVLDPHTNELQEEIEKVQNRVARFVTHFVLQRSETQGGQDTYRCPYSQVAVQIPSSSIDAYKTHSSDYQGLE